MKRVINAVIRIEYEQDTRGYWAKKPENEIVETAIDLAINPCFDTKICGTKLTSVSVDAVDKDKLIDWDKLKHCPDQVFVKQ